MADQLDIIAGQIVPTSLHTEVQRSYLEYAMSVIVGRALPDVRDGLKPVHRRILYAMHELGLTPDRPYRKCARVVGDVLGKYHPHGDQAVYEALVRMVQTFSSRYPLLDGHGNFGSVDNDPPAAMRYTETRLSPISNEAMLTDISEALVDFSDNFDSSQQEPVVLPTQLPNLLLNGSSGIAVGMATNIPPHNMGEVIDGLVAMIDRPTLSDDDLFRLIPGPDFPTGGEIIGTEGILDAYRTGRGSIPIRGICQFEEVHPGRGRQRRNAIIVTELPYQVNKAGWIEKIAQLVNAGRLEGIADIRDESDRDGMRVVIELKRDTPAQRVLQDLYRTTPLQTNFGVIMLALDDGQPRQMPLRDVMQAFLDFRETTLTRHYQHQLEKTEAKLHITEGLLTALNNLDAIIDILRNAADGTTAKQTFQQRFDLSERQSDAILAMPLRKLTGMERQGLENDFAELSQRRDDLTRLLSDRKELLKAMKKELKALKKKFNDPRRTRIQTDAERAEESQQVEDIIAETVEEATVVEFTQKGYVRRFSQKSYQRRQARLEVDTNAKLHEIDDDPVVQVEAALTTHELLTLTRDGRAFTVAVGTVPTNPRQGKGAPLVQLLPGSVPSAADAIVAQLVIRDDLLEHDLILVTRKGKIKRAPLKEFTNLTGRGLTAIKVKDGDELAYVTLAEPGDDLVLGTTGGRLLRFPIDDDNLQVMGRAAQGPQGIRMGKQETLTGCVAVQSSKDCLLLVSAAGYAKRLPVEGLRVAKRGDIGTQSFQFSLKTDSLMALLPAVPKEAVTVFTSAERTAVIPIASVPRQGRAGESDRIVKPNKGETITQVIRITPPDQSTLAEAE
ncbi:MULTISPECIES: DNA gyrase subunit A [Cyanophyceae]|uniref:DNA gyrase subunit A n=1 Tax=Cyanophyceae TaxID=3028117 RepID=UPI001685AB67|nr:MULTISPECIES: DNA gyrase subunit A [Cyanophyceae]MBD1919205.1 DNA gyrase subunit A [Phormidium sp. FACHB-77]MBD2033435.1 DNA gyrase subunit A [Phormidium sp. FACHB-322]MBD2054157.1 DNA gyrase subunit A [Leptolyngbya sp. FACHB-60]